MKLTNVEIHKYKSIETDQSFNVENDITVLVGMNEAGKTSVLEAMAKVNYFTEDENFTFNSTHDYPRKEKKQSDKSGEDRVAVTLTFSIDEERKKIINGDLGEGIFNIETFSYSKKYSNSDLYMGITTNDEKFFTEQAVKFEIDDDTTDELKNCKTLVEFNEILDSIEDEEQKEKVSKLQKYFKNSWDWESPISEYVAREHISPNLPKFLYYDEYYSLPSEVKIEELASSKNKSMTVDEYKTAKALFELADINIDELLNSDDFDTTALFGTK